MLSSRIIPCLLLQNKGLVKTVRFSDPKYVGDPLNAVKIFNEKEVDELIFLDIDATVRDAEPDYNLIGKIAAECRMPLCYGGGISTVEQARRIIQLGVEKVALSSAATESPSLLTEIASVIGSQSVVVVLDVRRSFMGSYSVYTHRGKKKIKGDFLEILRSIESAGVGEVVINSIDNDGVMKGFDLILVEKVREAIDVPLTVLGGAGSKKDIFSLVEKFKIIGVSAGSLFVFKGVYKAVLINYFTPTEKEEIRRLSN